jgi:hypothetical protein
MRKSDYKAYTAIFMLLAGVGLSVAGFCEMKNM